MRIPQFPPLHEVPQLLPPRLGHWLARQVGLDGAYSYFCHHCPEPTFWEADEDTPGEEVPSAHDRLGADGLVTADTVTLDDV